MSTELQPVGDFLGNTLANVHRIYWRKSSKFLSIEVEHSHLTWYIGISTGGARTFSEDALSLSKLPKYKSGTLEALKPFDSVRLLCLLWIRSPHVWASKTESIFSEDSPGSQKSKTNAWKQMLLFYYLTHLKQSKMSGKSRFNNGISFIFSTDYNNFWKKRFSGFVT